MFNKTNIRSDLMYRANVPAGRKHFDDRQFVIDWMTVDSIAAIAEKYGVSEKSISAKACNLRNKGVRLPKKHRVAIDKNSPSELNKLIKKYEKKDGKPVYEY